MEFDKWQQKMIDHKGSVTARCGRQVDTDHKGGEIENEERNWNIE